VAVRVRFSDGVGGKRRPAVVVSCAAYHESRLDAVIVPLTTQLKSRYFGDYDLLDWVAAGLPLPSRAKGVIQTIDRTTIDKSYGRLSARDLAEVRRGLAEILELA